MLDGRPFFGPRVAAASDICSRAGFARTRIHRRGRSELSAMRKKNVDETGSYAGQWIGFNCKQLRATESLP